MRISVRRTAYHLSLALTVLAVGFALSSGLAQDFAGKVSAKILTDSKNLLCHHIFTLQVNAKHYFILPQGSYNIGLLTEPLSYGLLALIYFNSVFNILFQPVFLSPFTPQVIVNILLLPFFIVGSIRYFVKVWPMLIIFSVLAFRVGIYDSGVEALIRHGMSCELIYLLIGLAGFAGLTAKNS